MLVVRDYLISHGLANAPTIPDIIGNGGGHSGINRGLPALPKNVKFLRVGIVTDPVHMA
jgi:hypothetical protein